MDYSLSIKKINEVNLNNEQNINIRYYNFFIESEHGTHINFLFKILIYNETIIFDLDENNKLINNLILFKNSLVDNLSCKFIFYDTNNLLRYIAYNDINRLFCLGILIDELTVDVNITISDNTRQQFSNEINEFLNNKR